MESRSGTKNSVNERNTDYLLALEVILLRLFKLNINLKPLNKSLVLFSSASKLPSMPSFCSN
jgi:hypothetical protein